MQLKTFVNKVAFNTRKASPYIFFGTGVITFGGAIATAIRATMKLEAILDAHKEERDYISKHLQGFEDSAENYTVEELAEEEKIHKKQVRTLYFHTIGKIGLLYAPTAALGALCLGSFTTSAGILRGRYLAAAGALESVSAAFDKYRAHVVEDYGEETDLEYYYDLKKEKITVEETDPETGKKKKVKKEVLTGVADGLYVYPFMKYDWQSGAGSTQWDQSPIYNFDYITGIIKAFQHNLDAGKTVYFDRLLDDLGFTHEHEYEHLAGWLPGDIISCGLENYDKFQDVRDFVDGKYPDVALRFNCRANVFALSSKDTKIIQYEDVSAHEEKENEVIVNE